MAEESVRRGPGRPSKAELEARAAAASASEPKEKPAAVVKDKIPLVKYICKKCKRETDERSHQIVPMICAWCRQPMKYTVDLPTE